jgi:hypothetical protein
MRREFTKSTDSKSEESCWWGAEAIDMKKSAAEPDSTVDGKQVKADGHASKKLSEITQQDEDREAKIRRKFPRDWTAEERCFIFRLARRREMDS